MCANHLAIGLGNVALGDITTIQLRCAMVMEILQRGQIAISGLKMLQMSEAQI